MPKQVSLGSKDPLEEEVLRKEEQMRKDAEKKKKDAEEALKKQEEEAKKRSAASAAASEKTGAEDTKKEKAEKKEDSKLEPTWPNIKNEFKQILPALGALLLSGSDEALKKHLKLTHSEAKVDAMFGIPATISIFLGAGSLFIFPPAAPVFFGAAAAVGAAWGARKAYYLLKGMKSAAS